MNPNDAFTTSHVFRADRQRVWDAWTKPEVIARWFGPKGSTMTIVSADIRPGGALHSRMDMPGGPTIWAKFVYREVTAPARLVWEHSFSNEAGDICGTPFGGEWPKVLINTVDFIESEHGTVVRVTSVPSGATSAEEAEFRGAMPSMVGGWGGSFDMLDELLAD